MNQSTMTHLILSSLVSGDDQFMLGHLQLPLLLFQSALHCIEIILSNKATHSASEINKLEHD